MTKAQRLGAYLLALSFLQAGPSSLGVALAKPPPPRSRKAPPAPPAPAPPPAAAAPAAPTIPTIGETLSEPARKEYEAAKGLFALGDSKGAFYKFQAAYELFPDPRLLWNMATCAKTMHAYADALRLVRRYFEKLGAGLLTDADRAEAQQAEKAFAALTTTFVFKPSEPGVEISVDGLRVETPSEPFIADLGPHQVTAKKPKFRELSLRISGKPMVETPIDLPLVAELHEGTLVVTASPADATIFLDGKAVAVGHYRTKLPVGGYLVKVTGKDRRAFQQDIQLRDDETRTLPVTLEAEATGGGLPTWLIVLGSAAVVGAGVGTVVYIATRPSKNDNVPPGSLQPGVLITSF